MMIKLRSGCGGIGIRARLRGVWFYLASSSLAIRIVLLDWTWVLLLTLDVQTQETLIQNGLYRSAEF